MSNLTYAEVDLSAIRNNVKAIRKRVGEPVKIMPAVKANGYGHGAIQVSRACLDGGADALCVSSLEEGVELRDAGVDVPILTLGCLPVNAAQAMVDYGITSTVCEIDYANALSDAAVRLGKTTLVHIKIDTGMGRIGIRPNDTLDFARTLAALPNVLIEGMFTHFPCSDESDRSFTLGQIEAFRDTAIRLKRAGIEVPLLHTSNSGGILAFPEADFNAVRPGIMIYGYYPSDEVARSIPIREAMTLKTHITFLKNAERGTSISYGRTHVLKRKSRVATLPIGYGDGYPRLLSNKGEAVVRGTRVPLIGRVCMDQCMIDVTDVPGVGVGDEVTLYGGGYDFLSVSHIAEKVGTISYEVLCNIGQRVPRVYFNG
ncbi:MAG: alanine racemase [Armatimonadota bacterium]|nr:alanine racemase [bacterium]